MKTLCSQKLENGNTDLLLLQIQDTQVPLSGQKYSKTKKICTSKLKTIMHSHKTRKPVEESREHAGCWLPTTLSALAPLRRWALLLSEVCFLKRLPVTMPVSVSCMHSVAHSK